MSTMSQRSHLTDSLAWRVVGRNRFLEIESAGRRPEQGGRRATTPNEDRYLVLTARRERERDTPKDERYSSPTTPSFGYWHHGFNSDCPKPSPWCRSVCSPIAGVFSSGGTVAVGIILRSCTKVSDFAVGVLVYGGISIDGRTDLYIIRDGPLTAGRYRDEILRPIVVPYAAAIRDGFILMDDNSRPHRDNLVEDSLFEEGIVRMELPAFSPDMNSIEHV
ncbi:transposable element Tcb2 transposase [Trichonephila clavipes]|nr:transposable element Tcb2 transposase [Trichonephila clavipes]